MGISAVSCIYLQKYVCEKTSLFPAPRRQRRRQVYLYSKGCV